MTGGTFRDSKESNAHVLIVSYRAPTALARCLASVSAHVPGWPVHVWDNSSEFTANIRQVSLEHPAKWHFSPENIGFSAAVNRLVATLDRSDEPFVLLNPDAVLLGPLHGLLKALRPGVAAVAPEIDGAGEKTWDNARRFPTVANVLLEHSGFAARFRRSRWSGRYAEPADEVDWASGACLAVSRDAWREVGPFDEAYWLYGEEVDWQLRAAQKGWRVRQVHEILVSHHAGGTVNDCPGQSETSRQMLVDNQRRLLRAHRGPGSAAAFRAGCAALGLIRRGAR